MCLLQWIRSSKIVLITATIPDMIAAHLATKFPVLLQLKDSVYSKQAITRHHPGRFPFPNYLKSVVILSSHLPQSLTSGEVIYIFKCKVSYVIPIFLNRVTHSAYRRDLVCHM
jgi:hypothetical protein